MKEEAKERCKKILRMLNRAAQETNHEIIFRNKETGLCIGLETLEGIFDQFLERES